MTTLKFKILFIFTSALSVRILAATEGQINDFVAPTAILESTEKEFKKINSDLKDTFQQIKSIKNIATTPGLGTQTIGAKKALNTALEAFKAKDWMTTVHEMNSYLTLTQKPDSQNWQKAQFILARCYEEQGYVQKSIRAYTRFLASYATSNEKDDANLTEAFERLVKLSTKTSKLNQKELSTFLSSIASIEFPSSISEELNYLKAIAGSNIGQKNLAIDWLSDVASRSDAPETKARAKYFRSLIAINSKDWMTASEQLESILPISGISEKTKFNSYIALARVYLKQNKPELALAFYNKISEESDLYRDAAFEKVYLLIRLNRDDEARFLAGLWISKYPLHEDAIQLRVITSWLDLRNGDLDAAGASIGGITNKLSNIQSKINSDFQHATLTHSDAIALERLTRGEVTTSSDLNEILILFRRISEMKERLSDIQGVEKSILFAIAKSDFKNFQPTIANQMNQYERIIDRILSNGARLSEIEKQRLGKLITEIDEQKLQANHQRRLNLFSKRSQLSRQFKTWSSWIGPTEELMRLAINWEKVSQLEAIGTARDKYASTREGQANNDQIALKERFAATKLEMLSTLVDIKKIQAKNKVEQSNLNDMLYILEQYSSSLESDRQIFVQYEPNSDKILDGLDDEDSRTNWHLWQQVVGSIHSEVKSLQTRASREVDSILETLAKFKSTREKLLDETVILNNILETYGGESLTGIISHYDNALNQRLAKQQKWAGDLEYLKYIKVKNTGLANEKKRALENQILGDNLHNMEQGGAKQWPR